MSKLTDREREMVRTLVQERIEWEHTEDWEGRVEYIKELEAAKRKLI